MPPPQKTYNVEVTEDQLRAVQVFFPHIGTPVGAKQVQQAKRKEHKSRHLIDIERMWKKMHPLEP